jgi:hypothetical protein
MGSRKVKVIPLLPESPEKHGRPAARMSTI